MGFLVTYIGYGSESEILVQVLLDNLVALGQGDMHLDGALAVAHIVHFLLGDIVDVLEHSW